MFQHLVVPVDGSAASFDAVTVAARMAAAVAGGLHVVSVVERHGEPEQSWLALERGIDRCRPLAVEPIRSVVVNDSVAGALGRLVETTPGTVVAMSSHGHGRSAAVLGGTTDGVLHELFGPIIVVGPHCALDRAGTLDGTYVVPLDGSLRADEVLPIVAAWTIEFGGTPWLVEVLDDSAPRSSDLVESAYVSHRANELRHRIDRGVEYEALHGSHPARSTVDFAMSEEACLIFLTTHGRTGLDRLRSGSVAADIVRRAVCPVVLFRPPDLLSTTDPPVTDEAAVVPPEWSRAWCEQYADATAKDRADRSLRSFSFRSDP